MSYSKEERLAKVVFLQYLLDQAADSIKESTQADICIIFVAQNNGMGVINVSGGEMLGTESKDLIMKHIIETFGVVSHECYKVGEELKKNQC